MALEIFPVDMVLAWLSDHILWFFREIWLLFITEYVSSRLIGVFDNSILLYLVYARNAFNSLNTHMSLENMRNLCPSFIKAIKNSSKARRDVFTDKEWSNYMKEPQNVIRKPCQNHVNRKNFQSHLKYYRKSKNWCPILKWQSWRENNLWCLTREISGNR